MNDEPLSVAEVSRRLRCRSKQRLFVILLIEWFHWDRASNFGRFLLLRCDRDRFPDRWNRNCLSDLRPGLRYLRLGRARLCGVTRRLYITADARVFALGVIRRLR
jgi:hypothetical protein